MIARNCTLFAAAGSGKSHLLVATIVLLSELFESSALDDESRKPQILVASATNVAVDNILLGLQSSGSQDFARIGSVKKIAKPVCYPSCFQFSYSSSRSSILCDDSQLLKCTAHAPGADTARAIADMKFMLSASGKYGLLGAERDCVQEAIDKLESKKVHECPRRVP